MSNKKNLGHNSKKDFLKSPVEHIDITSFDSRKIIQSMKKMSFVSRETSNAADIFNEMIKENDYIELGQLGAYGLTFRTDFNGLYSNNIFELEDRPIMTMYDKEFDKQFLVA